jgi:bis(5'-nucleosidyl)-tetraphosphatase
MVLEFSFGIIPLQKVDHVWNVLLIQHTGGHWSFPKGHAEAGENSKQAAERELNEETGLTIERWLEIEPLTEQYFFTVNGKRVKKTVKYFLAEVKGKLKIQLKEIKAAKWVPLAEAESHVSFPAAKSICKQAQSLLEGT